MTPRVALVNDRMRLACMQVTIEQAVKEAVDFPKAKGLVPFSSSGPANHGCIRGDSRFAGSGQPIHDVRRIQIHAGLS